MAVISLLFLIVLFIALVGGVAAFRKSKEQERMLQLPPGYGPPGGAGGYGPPGGGASGDYTPAGRQLDSDHIEAGLLNLRLNDIISHFGRDYIIEGRIDHWDDGDTWVSYMLVDGDETVWLTVEQDDEVEVSMWREVSDLRLRDPMPEFVEYRGRRYRMEERGEARVNHQGRVGRKTGVTCKYYEYETEDGDMMSVEDWGGGDVEVFLGEEINAAGLEILPGDHIE